MLQLPAFRNEPYLDFTKPENRQAMQKAMEKVRGELGRERRGHRLVRHRPSTPVTRITLLGRVARPS